MRLHIEHLDITGEFIHEAFGYDKTVYVRKMRRPDGSYRNGETVGVLNGNMYVGKSAGNYFIKGLIKRLLSHGCRPTDMDPCLFYKRIDDEFILFSICIDYFLIVSIQRR